MNNAADPAFVAAEVAYRFERGHIVQPPVRPARQDEHRFGQWLRRLTHRPSRPRRAAHTGHA